MAALETPICDFGVPAPDFALVGVDGRTWTLADVRGRTGTVVMFICNHCPFVKAAIGRMIHEANELAGHGVSFVAIMSNDTATYPADSYENMQRWAAENDFPFPYLIDEMQDVARAYGAVCTPDFFGYNADLELQYRGRLDAGRTEPPPAGAPRELYEAMKEIARTGKGPTVQTPSIGCSIKWKAG
ncbi:MAG: thioredoxin family protein [Gammaproteobacteria bacterium]|nr:thioredoxin family protein [Gammaproteobacteria bacterium]MDH3768301.1 thioredoxin family protein [Gammaproteobacteria bacterium]